MRHTTAVGLQDLLGNCIQACGIMWCLSAQGAAIMAAVAVVVLVTAVNNYQKEQQFRTLNQINEDIKVGL